MKKNLLALILSLFLVVGLAPMAASATTDNATACCPGSNNGCPMDKGPCAHKVLNKEECQRFCKAKAAAIAKDPSLAQPEKKSKLCRAMVKADPSMKPLCMKVRKNCRKMKKQCSQTPSQENANASSSSSMNSPVVAASSSASITESQSSSSTSPAN